MMKSKLMSQKYVTQLLNREELYKEGDYTDVFINRERMGSNIHDYNMHASAARRLPFK